jgi:hypothetical protein
MAMILWRQLPMCWHDRCVPTCLAQVLLFFENKLLKFILEVGNQKGQIIMNGTLNAISYS